MKDLNLHLYLVTDEAEKCRLGLLDTVRQAVVGGVTCVQYRTTQTDRKKVLAEALPLRDFLRKAGIPFIVNNHVDLALELEADGLHIGQKDTPVAEARRRLGRNRILGLSVSNESQMRAVDPSLVNYVGCGPVFPTVSKHNAPPALGVEEWARLAALSPVPVVAIGGLDAERAKAIRATGQAAGVAVVSAICSSEHPLQAARELL